MRLIIFLIWLRYNYISMCNISIHSQHFPFFFFLFFEFLSLGSGVVSFRPGAFKDAPAAELFDPWLALVESSLTPLVVPFYFRLALNCKSSSS
jgi:hypothetical protein